MSYKGALVNSEPETQDSVNGNASLAPSMAVKTSKVMQTLFVLELIAKNLPGSDLKNLRPTSKWWNRTFDPQLQSNHSVITLKTPDELDAFSAVVRADQSLDLPFPFTKYEIKGLRFPTQRISEDFFNICGYSVTNLSLSFRQRFEISKIRQVFSLAPNLIEFSLTTNFRKRPMPTTGAAGPMPEIPKLRRLVLINTNDNFGDGHYHDVDSLQKEWKDFLCDLLKGATGLESFALKANFDFHFHKCNAGAAEAIRDSLVHLSKLKSLQMFKIEEPELRILVELAHRHQNPLRLQEFHSSVVDRLDITQCGEIFQLLYHFLDAQSTSLLDLSLKLAVSSVFGSYTQNPRPLRIPRMEKLQNCEIGYGMPIRRFPVEFEGETLAANFPSLKRFVYKSGKYKGWTAECSLELDMFWPDDRPKMVHEGVTDLGLRATSTTLAEIAPSLPSVTRLEFDLASTSLDCFPLLWTTWPGLKSLHIRFRKNEDTETTLELDNLLSGIPKSAFKSLELEMGEEVLTLERIRQLLDKHKTNPGISDLKQLQKVTLQMQGDENDCSFLLTDIGGYFCFAMASSRIQNLAILVDSPGRGAEGGPCTGNLMSSKCRDMIKSVVHPFATIDI